MGLSCSKLTDFFDSIKSSSNYFNISHDDCGQKISAEFLTFIKSDVAFNDTFFFHPNILSLSP